ncbi:MAG: 30S ribosomal protein S6 [Verrucomicrobiae bacterium]
MKRYEALLALDTRGKEDTTKETIERLEKLLAAEGAVIEQVQRLEKREFAYESKHTKSAYYVNLIFEADPSTIDKIQKKLKLDNAVILQNYLQLPAKKTPATP